MELISMINFVLKQSERIMNFEITHLESHEQIVDYAKFLTQNLKLEMFVPCDEYGIPMEKPKISCATCEKCTCSTKYFQDYEKAQSKILFKGFEIVQIARNFTIVINSEKDCQVFSRFHNEKFKRCNEFETIEDLIFRKINLTENVKKQL